MAIKTWTNKTALTNADMNAYAVNGGLKFISEYSLQATNTSSFRFSGVFTSEFENYRVLIEHVSNLTFNPSQALSVRLSTGGVDNATSTYNYARRNRDTSNVASTNAFTAQQQWNIGSTRGDGITGGNNFVLDVFRPFAVNYTGMTCRSTGITGALFTHTHMAGTFPASTIFDGITIFDFGTAGLSNGVARVYGYRKT